nr:uncharacterized protein LOC113809224 [Penaeus vannamei]
MTTCPGPYQTQNPPISTIPGTSGAPCYTRITDSRGTINTPYYPKKYPESLDCVYEFIRSGEEVCGIKMQTVNFEMENPVMTFFGAPARTSCTCPPAGSSAARSTSPELSSRTGLPRTKMARHHPAVNVATITEEDVVEEEIGEDGMVEVVAVRGNPTTFPTAAQQEAQTKGTRGGPAW